MTYGDSACGLGAAMAKPGRRCLFHETTGLVRIATNCVLAPWRLCVEFPSDFVRMKRKVAGKQRRNETGGCCLVSPFNGPTAARRTLRFPPSYRVLQWRNQEIQSAGQRAAAERHGMHIALMGAVDGLQFPCLTCRIIFRIPIQQVDIRLCIEQSLHRVSSRTGGEIHARR